MTNQPRQTTTGASLRAAGQRREHPASRSRSWTPLLGVLLTAAMLLVAPAAMATSHHQVTAGGSDQVATDDGSESYDICDQWRDGSGFPSWLEKMLENFCKDEDEDDCNSLLCWHDRPIYGATDPPVAAPGGPPDPAPQGSDPVAKFIYLPSAPVVGEEMLFIAAGSVPGYLQIGSSSDLISIEEYLWDFGDGHQGQGEFATHKYEEAGNYTVTLTVVDLIGREDTTSQTFSVEAPPETSGVGSDGSASEEPTGTLEEEPSEETVDETAGFFSGGVLPIALIVLNAVLVAVLAVQNTRHGAFVRSLVTQGADVSSDGGLSDEALSAPSSQESTGDDGES